MTVREVTPDVDRNALLPGAQFSDAYRLETGGQPLAARQAAERMMGRSPRWVDALLRLRNILVAPFDLKSSGTSERMPKAMIGMFPVLSEAPDRLVAGFNDKHLDFRVVVVAASGAGQQITATTLVLTHNWLGRSYLAIILPFHRLIVRTQLRPVAA